MSTKRGKCDRSNVSEWPNSWLAGLTEQLWHTRGLALSKALRVHNVPSHRLALSSATPPAETRIPSSNLCLWFTSQAAAACRDAIPRSLCSDDKYSRCSRVRIPNRARSLGLADSSTRRVSRIPHTGLCSAFRKLDSSPDHTSGGGGDQRHLAAALISASVGSGSGTFPL